LAAFSNLTLGLASARGSVLLQGVGLLLLAVTSLVTWGLLLATWRGLRDKTLLAPEPVATLTPVSG
jgi:tellurite resistance protein